MLETRKQDKYVHVFSLLSILYVRENSLFRVKANCENRITKQNSCEGICGKLGLCWWNGTSDSLEAIVAYAIGAIANSYQK